MANTDLFAWFETLGVAHAVEALFVDQVQCRATVQLTPELAEPAEEVRAALHRFYELISSQIDKREAEARAAEAPK